MIKKVNKYKTWYGVSLVLLPILFQYATFVPSFTVGDFFYLLSLLLMIGTTHPVKWHKGVCVLIIYVAFLTAIFLLEGRLERPTTSLRYMVYLIGVMLMPNLEGNSDKIWRAFDKTGKFVVLLLIIQYFGLTVLGIAIPGVLTFLPLTDDTLLDYGGAVERAGRCMSVFAEPSHFAIYAILFLFFKLFENAGIDKKSMIWALITSAAIIMSASFTGVLGMIAVWGLKIFTMMRSKKMSITLILALTIGMVVLFWIVVNTTAGSYITNQDIYERQSADRFSGFQYIYDLTFGDTDFLFGKGMNDIAELEYLSGWPRLFFYYGLIGTFLYVICIALCAKGKTLSVLLTIIIAILMVGTEMNFGSFFMSYMLCVFLYREKPIKESRTVNLK